MGVIVNSVNMIKVNEVGNVFSISERLNLKEINKMMASNVFERSKGCPVINEYRVGRGAT